MRLAAGIALAAAASLALAQAPAQREPRLASSTVEKSGKAHKAKASQKAHAKPTPEQVRKFDELQKRRGKP